MTQENINKLEFNRKFIIKRIRKMFDKFIITCKIYKCDNKDQIISNFKKIIKKLNSDFMTDKLFNENQLIQTYLNEIESYLIFLREYESTIQKTDSELIIKESSQRFEAMQNNFLNKLNKEFNPYQCLIKTHI